MRVQQNPSANVKKCFAVSYNWSHILKKLYFQRMEFKLIIYIIGAIVWAVYNYNQNKQKLFQPKQQPTVPNSNKPDLLDPNKKSNLDTTQVPKNVSINKRTEIIKNSKVQKTESSQVFVPTNYQEGPKSKKEFSTKTENSRLDEFDQDPTTESLGSLIGNELRSGEVDFRRAIILTEILRPAYITK